MTSTPMTNLTGARADRPLLTPAGWGWLVVLGGLFAVLHWTFIYRTYLFATTDNNWSHALVVPLIGAYYIYQNRTRLLATPRRIAWAGLPILFFGLFSYAWWIYPGQNDMFRGYSMIIALFGLALFCLGWPMMRVLWFPIVYLVFAVKVSERIWERIAWELQLIAAGSSTVLLKFIGAILGFRVDNRGSTIDLTYQFAGSWVTEPINVAEACSGLRMLMAFLALGVATAFIFNRAWWQRVIIVAMTLPIAIGVNVGRVTTIGLLYIFNKDMATGDFHTFVGMLMLIPAFGLFMLLGWVLDHIIIRDDDEEAGGSEAQASGVVAAGAGAEASPGPLSIGAVVRGVAAGGVLAALVGLLYALVLASFQPDVLLEGLSRPIVLSLLGGTAVLLVAAAAGLPRLLPDRAGPARARRHQVALGVAAGVLGVAMIGQNAVIATQGAVLIKKPVPLRKPLVLIPGEVGPWKLVREDPPLSKELVEELGTKHYLSRVYADTRVAQDQPIDLARGLYERGSLARVHVAYYTGNPDTVPHVPDRCFVAGGLEAIAADATVLRLDTGPYLADPEAGGFVAYSDLAKGEVRVPATEIDARLFTFAIPGRAAENVTYFFAANGKFLPSPERVRLQGFDPTDKYSYYCKIEVQVFGVADPAIASERAASLLTHLLPEVMACLPDWVEVTAGRYPTDEDK